MTARAAVLAESKLIGDGLGPPPLPYAVLVLGSAGRGESQLAADQDNAIVYADGADPAAVDRYFEMLAIEMSRILDLAGIPLCKGGVMASNRAWRKSVSEWHATIDGWVRHQTPQDLLAVDIFFDAVGVHGDPSLADDIWQHAYNRGSASVDFVKMLTESARTRTRPFSMFGNLRVDAKGRFDVKKTGLLPLFTAARVLSIRHGVRARATSDRLAGVVAHGVGSAETLAALIAAQRTLFGAVIDQQLADLDAGVPPTPTVVPSRLDSAAKSRLKQALQDVARALDLVSEGRL
jgi:DNA polymerase-3 subunit epsilon/CBS domain-containing protein